ncbi:MAG: Ig-like domain-containing protein [Prevotellaceae bacterium]|jgi:uncharacterized protein YjdB|nr:Ig-like domain-containing protein [Prevotellaceae bacterium]
MKKRKIFKEIILSAMICIASISCQKQNEEPVVPVTGIKLNENTVSLNTGSEAKLIPSIIPNNATNQTVKWLSGNPGIATVDDSGLIKGISVGKAVITATTVNNGKIDSCIVTVNAISVPVTGIKVTPETAKIKIKATFQLAAAVLPTDATNKKVTFKSNDDNVATVNENGLITGISAGKATIIATTNDGRKKDSCIVTVDTDAISVTGIALTLMDAGIEVNQTTKIIVHVQPAAATNKKVTFKSSDENVATVNENGLITGKSAGAATITVTSEDGGKTATCIINVTEKQTSLLTWYISNSNNIEGAPAGTSQKMKDILDQIKKAKANNKFTGGKKAVIVVNGIVNPTTEAGLSNNSLVNITGAGIYPDIVLRGSSSGGTLDANNKARVLNIIDNRVTIDGNITLTGGNTVINNQNFGGGIYIEKSSLEMIDGTISNCIALGGAGVYIANDKLSIHSSFSMKGGTIKDCTTKGKAAKSGAGVYVDSYCSFHLSGGLISNNGADGNTDDGGGVSINGFGEFTMSGGEISGNKANEKGGGISVSGYGIFNLSNGKITNNTAPVGGGSGVYISKYGAIFNQTGGTINGNNGNPDLKL